MNVKYEYLPNHLVFKFRVKKPKTTHLIKNIDFLSVLGTYIIILLTIHNGIKKKME